MNQWRLLHAKDPHCLPFAIEERGLRLEFRPVLPDREAWHLEIRDMQLSTYHVLSADPDAVEVTQAVMQHFYRKRLCASRN